MRCEFAWDRFGKDDENSSCWIRVSNFASGDRFGNTHLPRIGQEVIVAYLAGDPDRPMIVGVVNNQFNLPPWDLPNQLALSGYQSKELYGEGRNQTLYDDTQGQQQVQVARTFRTACWPWATTSGSTTGRVARISGARASSCVPTRIAPCAPHLACSSQLSRA